ncbi:MAG: vanadium-dependent haloperoxidase [Pseudomonadota bacterium]
MTQSDRRQAARNLREEAAELARARIHPDHVANADEHRFRIERNNRDVPSYLLNFTKGLPHDYNTGLVADPAAYQQFVRAIDSGDPVDFRNTPLGHPDNCIWDHWQATHFGDYWCSDKARHGGENGGPVAVRAWESQGAGLTFDLQGPDAHAVTMPPAPATGSNELTAEMGEVYAQALLRDLPISTFMFDTPTTAANQDRAADLIDALNALPGFGPDNDAPEDRHRGPLNLQTAFRGIAPGDDVGPYLSQFLLVGNPAINGNDSGSADEGRIAYGAVTIDQRVRVATPRDYMTNWDEWFDVQNGADLRGLESYEPGGARRLMATPRDLATYVHYDALYEAYLNACLIMLGGRFPFDPGIPFQEPDNRDHQQGFAQFGGPHILSLVTEVATRALKAVRYQKFNVHRRARPEVLAARLERFGLEGVDAPELGRMFDQLNDTGILAEITDHNEAQNLADGINEAGLLLPMAFCEGSPMHPAYGAGHATVAGACVTILKAFFDTGHIIDFTGDPNTAFVPSDDGSTLNTVDVLRPEVVGDDIYAVSAQLNVEGELNKLAANISIGRDWAGVHYFTDYIESIRMGETIALGLLEEQKLTYGENFSMTVPLFDGGAVRI